MSENYILMIKSICRHPLVGMSVVGYLRLAENIVLQLLGRIIGVKVMVFNATFNNISVI